MNENEVSLERLHDLVPPPEVAAWPPAPGWYVMMAAAGALLFLLFLYRRRVWRANAWRREALRDLEAANDAASIAELLRRAALAIAPREEIALTNGTRWAEWLAGRLPQPMPDEVRAQLIAGPYAPGSGRGEISPFKNYARAWITGHRPPETTSEPAT